MTRRRIPALAILALLGALAVAALGAAGARHIGPDELGASSSGWLNPGWHWVAPFSTVTRIPRTGSLDLGSIDAPTPGGETRTVTVRADYRLADGARGTELSAAVAREGGLVQALRPSLGAALAEALRSGGSGAARARAGTTSDPVGTALAAGLERMGLTVQTLDWRRQASALGPAAAALPRPARKRVLLIGLDGADWQIIDPLMAQGKLPNLARLVRAGARAPLRSYDPMISPLIWTTMVTGVGPDAHGVADFLVTDPGTRMQIPITSRFRRVKAAWNIFTESGLSSGFVGWWATYPAESVNGVLVTDLMGFSLLKPASEQAASTAGITWPATYYDQIRPRMVLPDQIRYEEVSRFIHASRAEYDASIGFQAGRGFQPGRARPAGSKAGGVPGAAPGATNDTPQVQDPVWLVRRAVAMTRNYAAIAEDLLSKNLDVVGVYFEGIDLMGHRFQHCLPPRTALCPESDFAKWESAVTSFYAFQDEIIGGLLARDPQRTVMVVSDHGFRSGADRPADYLPYTTGQPVEWHREYGVLVLSGPGVRPGAKIDAPSVYDIAPTLLYLSGLPSGKDMPGRVLSEALDPSDLASHPPARIASYEDVGTVRKAVPAQASASSPEAQQEMVENLQALGYIGPVTAPSPEGPSREGSAQPSAGGGPAQGERVMYHRNMATYYLKSGRPAEAESELQAANRIQPLPKTFELLSEIRAGKGDVDGAVGYLEEGLKTFPEMDQDAVLWMMDLRLATGRADRAAQVLDRWRARLTRPAVLDTCEGKLAAARGEADLAIAKFMAALSKEPAMAQAAMAAAPLLDARGRLAELEPVLSRALAGERRLDEYQNLLGVIRLKAGRPDEAMAALAQALDVDPTNARFLDNFGAAAMGARQPERALERYRAATRDARATGAVWAGYGRLLGMTRRPAEAAQAFARARQLGEVSASTYLGYATSLFQSGDRARSREILREGLRSFPSDPALIELNRRLG